MRGIVRASEADRVTSWDSIFDLAEQTAPRVGNLKVDVSCDLFVEFQKMAPEMCVESLFVCRGKERLQVPVGSVPQYPISFHCERQQVLTGKQVRFIPQTLKTGII